MSTLLIDANGIGHTSHDCEEFTPPHIGSREASPRVVVCADCEATR